MTRRFQPASLAMLCFCAVAGLAAQPGLRAQPAAAVAAAPAAGEALSPDDIERFLLEAEIVEAKPIGKGVTKPWRLTLAKGTLTHDAAFQSVDRSRENVRFKNGKFEPYFRDYYGFNIAAYRLARLLGEDQLVPVSVQRTWRGQDGALTWWIDKKWDEDERIKAGVQPPDLPAWERQVYRARVFTALVEDSDRNLGNQLVTADFKLWLIDFTRAFRRESKVSSTAMLRKIDRELFDRMKALTDQEFSKTLRPYVNADETRALLRRRQAIIAHFEKIAVERGAENVFF